MKHTKTILLAITLSTIGLAEAAHADSGRPGTRGTISAYAPSPNTVVESRRCSRTRHSWNYTTCGKLVRAEVKRQLCSRLGKGLHRYYYQIGNGRKSRSSVYCKYGTPTGPIETNDAPSTTPPRDPVYTGPTGRHAAVAFFPTRFDAFDSQRCSKRGRTLRYSRCSKVLRDRVKSRICARRGRGLHNYYIKLGESRKRKSSVYCR